MPTYHDHLAPNRWGHAITFNGYTDSGERQVTIFQLERLREGDVVLLRSATKRPGTDELGILQYRVVGPVRTPIDPGDLHFTALEFMAAETNAADGKDPR